MAGNKPSLHRLLVVTAAQRKAEEIYDLLPDHSGAFGLTLPCSEGMCREQGSSTSEPLAPRDPYPWL